jgi:DNA repair photolyase
MIREIGARTIIHRVSGIDTYFGLDYGMNLYRGCQHRCIYCDSRSLCYGIEDFDGEILIKKDAIDLLRDELSRKRKKGIIGTGSMHDAYMPLEAKVRLTQRALEAIADYGFGVHVVTKSDLVLRDVPILKIARFHTAAVSLTITTTDDELSKKLEPGAPPSSARFRALQRLCDAGLETRIALMPTLPFIEDTQENIVAIVEEAHRCGVKAIVPWFGMSMRDRQRSHFYKKLDELFPGLKTRYIEAYGEAYNCPSPNADALYKRFHELCGKYGISTSVKPHLMPSAAQPGLFD